MRERRIEPGFFEYRETKIKSYDKTKSSDISAMIVGLQFTESTAAGYISGYMVLLDTLNFVEKFPLRGEEYFEMVYRDSRGVEDRQTFFIYAVTDVEPNKHGNGVIYRLHFTTYDKMKSEMHIINKSLRGTCSNIAKSVFDQYYESDKPLVLEESEGSHVFIIPRYTPEKTMHFLAQRAFSESSKSNSFRFFENRKAFYFATDHKLLDMPDEDQIVQLYYDVVPENDGVGLAQATAKLISMSTPVRVDNIATISENGFNHRTLEIDVLKKTFFNRDVEYDKIRNDFPQHDGNQRRKYSQMFYDDFTKNRIQSRSVMKDYAGPGEYVGNGAKPETAYDKIFGAKNMYFQHTDDSRIKATIYGRNDIFAGSVVNINLPQFRMTDDKLGARPANGIHIVEEITTIFEEDTMTQTMYLSKLDWHLDVNLPKGILV